MYDDLTEIRSRNNEYYQMWKAIQKFFNAKNKSSGFHIFKGLKFYRWDLSPEEHLKEYDKTNGRCCFNHFIGLPEKDDKVFPLFDYQETLFNDFMASWNGSSKYRFHAILKATGLGITEFSIRLMAWLAACHDDFRGKRFGIIAGIREEIVLEILRRFVDLFRRFPFLGIRVTRRQIEINGVLIEGYPAENVQSLRSYANFAFILVDEADFFQKSLQKEVRTGVERYIAKTNPFVYFVSTPDKPNGMFYEIFSKAQKDTFYRQYRLDYRVGLNKIFTSAQIEEQKKSEFFEREYNIQFGGLAGNLLSQHAIKKNIVDAATALKLEFFPYMTYKEIEFRNEDRYYPKALGLDPGFGSNPDKDIGSYTGLTLLQERNGRLEVLYTEELIQPDFDELVRIVTMIAVRTNCTKIYCDGSNPALVKSLKNSLNENPNYAQDYTPEEMNDAIYGGRMIICPIPFNARTKKEMLFGLKDFVDKGLLTIHEDQKNLIDCLSSAFIENDKLDKEKTARDDLFDSTSLALLNYQLAPKRRIPNL